jgi:RimJ/RimL family protein N-acetyltransferase
LLKTADIQLVPIEVDHLDEIMKNFNDPELRRFLGGFIPYSRLQEEEWIESMQMEMKKRSNFTFAIERLPKKQFIAIEFAWKSLNLRRIELSVHEYNERAKHVYEKLGFVEYGKAHQKYFIDGKYVNTYYMELLRDTEKQFMKICDK